MTQEDKELLLKDLCARLPYGVIVKSVNSLSGKLLSIDIATKRETIVFFSLLQDSRTCDRIDNIKPYLRPMSSITGEEKLQLIQYAIIGDGHIAGVDFVDWVERKNVPSYIDWLNAHHFDYRGLIEKGLALKAKEGMYSEAKWLYRLEYKDDTNGLWYNGNGNWCFEKGIGSIEGCKTRTLPMDYDERYKQDGMDWFSSCSKKEDLLHWYSLEDAKKLIDNGFVFTRYLATEYHEYDLETVFIKETSIDREVLDIFDLFKDN